MNRKLIEEMGMSADTSPVVRAVWTKETLANISSAAAPDPQLAGQEGEEIIGPPLFPQRILCLPSFGSTLTLSLTLRAAPVSYMLLHRETIIYGLLDLSPCKVYS